MDLPFCAVGKVNASIFSCAIAAAIPAEDLAERRALPGLEVEQLAGERSLDVVDIVLDEIDDALRLGFVEIEFPSHCGSISPVPSSRPCSSIFSREKRYVRSSGLGAPAAEDRRFLVVAFFLSSTAIAIELARENSRT